MSVKNEIKIINSEYTLFIIFLSERMSQTGDVLPNNNIIGDAEDENNGNDYRLFDSGGPCGG